MTDDRNDAPDVPADTGGLDYGRLYEFRFRDVEQRARQTVWNEIGPFVWKRMGSPARVLDPAGGRGEFVNSIAADERWLVDLVDYPHRRTVPGVKVVIGDVLSLDLPRGYFDGIFVSNLLEHLADPDAVAGFLARMRGALAPGGVLAVQMPRNFDAPSHVLMRETAAQGPWAVRLMPQTVAGSLAASPLRLDPVGPPEFYYDLLRPLAGGGLDLWETEYLHVLAGDDPVLEWVRGSA
ncbi:MAG TPA: methyltransferase domain-containing protein, partial [Acidimicrobiia bacterium]